MKSLIEFTTLSNRDHIVLGSAGEGEYAEIYLDELSRMLGAIMKRGNFDFHIVVELLLAPTVLHEILHYFGAKHSFIVRAVTWVNVEGCNSKRQTGDLKVG